MKNNSTLKRFAVIAMACSFTHCVVTKPAGELQTWENYYKSKLNPAYKLIEAGSLYTIEKAPDHYVVKQYYFDTKTIISEYQTSDRLGKVKSGKETIFTDEGVKKQELNYVSGQLSGEALTFNAVNGKIEYRTQYNNGNRDGLQIEYDSLGNKIAESFYKAGELNGTNTNFNPDGSVKSTAIYEKGKLIKGTGTNEVPESFDIESAPEFPCNPEYAAQKKCGEYSLLVYLSKQVQYPKIAIENEITGTALISFVVDRDGSVTDVTVIRGICNAIRNESVRVVKNMPKWTPGMANGKPVKVKYTLPIKFKLT